MTAVAGRAFHYVRLDCGLWLADRSRVPWTWSERSRLAFACEAAARVACEAVHAPWNGAEVVSETVRSGGSPWLAEAVAAGWRYEERRGHEAGR